MLYLRKSLSLVELIFAIAIISIVVIGSLSFINKSYQAYNHSKDSIILELELKSTLKYIQNKLQYSSDLKYSQNSIEWNEIDFKGFRTKQWSGYIDINQSTPTQIKSILSNFDDTTSSKLIKIDNKNYQIQSNTKDTITLKNSLDSNISQTYILLNAHYKIELKDSILYLDKEDFNSLKTSQSILLKNVSKFNITKNQNILDIQICIYQNQICAFRSILINE